MLYAFPPAWFLGLNEVLLGSTDPVFRALDAMGGSRGRRGGAGGCRRLHAGISKARAQDARIDGRFGVHSHSGGQWLSALADRIARHPVERATVSFVGKTIARSARHRIFLAAYAGVGCAFVLQALVGTGLRQAWLSIPLVLSFFVLSGMRYIFTLPSELPANWLFRVTESDERRRALDGARTAMLWFGVAPLFVALAPFYFVLWSPGIALAHFAFSVVISVLLVEVLLLDFWKIPFTCSYPPGKANVTILWIFYWLAFTTYAYSMATLEAWMVMRPMRLVGFYFVAMMVWIGFQWYRRRWDNVGFTLVFDDVADPVVRTLNLSEFAWRRKRAVAFEPLVHVNKRE